ncbi:MAG: glycoside hydrolase family 43 protein [Spirochaetaceae bacterium]|nr:glycoside hydrolase family 43 protein [Spirochaetaceae bacterium]
MNKIKNPVLTGFHPDPSILCVGDDFYIANSTFEYYPSVQISHSKDLANWDTIGAVLDKKQLNMIGDPCSGGVWAPCLTYSEGLYYIVYTDVKTWRKKPFKDTHNYISYAKNIEGPWSEGIYINSSGFDASLFHEKDGKKYFVNMEWNWKKSLGGNQFSGILLTELDSITLKPKSKSVNIFKGSKRALTEGPHIFKRNNYYYLITAEGGTSYEHAVTIARSKNIYGPYEIHPNTHLATSYGNTEAELHKTGHGSLCEGPDGRWFLATLCGRPVDSSGNCPLGRETALDEVIWNKDWPYLKNGTSEMSGYFTGYGEKKEEEKVFDYNFSESSWQKDFMSLRKQCNYRIDGDSLVIRGGESPVSNHNQSFLGRRQTDFEFRATVDMEFDSTNFQELSGLNYRYDETNFYYLCISNEAYDKNIELHIIANQQSHYSLPLGENGLTLKNYTGYIRLRIESHRAEAKFSYSLDGKNFITIPYVIDVHFLSDERATPMGFTGAFVGMQTCDLQYGTKEAKFKNFIYEKLD